MTTLTAIGHHAKQMGIWCAPQHMTLVLVEAEVLVLCGSRQLPLGAWMKWHSWNIIITRALLHRGLVWTPNAVMLVKQHPFLIEGVFTFTPTVKLSQSQSFLIVCCKSLKTIYRANSSDSDPIRRASIKGTMFASIKGQPILVKSDCCWDLFWAIA